MFRAVCFAIALFVSGAGTAQARQPEMADVWNGAEIDWRDIKSGIYEAAKSGKTAVMVFHATWCSACKQYRRVFKDPGVVAASKNFVMILVDADADKMANGAFAPDGTYVPRTLFLNSDGDVLKAYVGKDPKFPHTIDNEDPAELRTLMQRAAADRGGDPAARDGASEVKTSD
ncbi:MAG: thioredoxin family protein [Hyphomicrobium sp.]